MASTEDFAALVAEAYEKAARSRDQLASAQDCLKEAHKLLADALEGSSDPERDSVLSYFAAGSDPVFEELWIALSAGMEILRGLRDGGHNSPI